MRSIYLWLYGVLCLILMAGGFAGLSAAAPDHSEVAMADSSAPYAATIRPTRTPRPRRSPTPTEQRIALTATEPGIHTQPSPTPYMSPTPTACVLTSRLEIGKQGRVLPGTPNNLRAEPNINSTRIGSIPGNGVFTVLDGPVCSRNGILYWQVDYLGKIGWTGEGQNNVYWVEPY